STAGARFGTKLLSAAFGDGSRLRIAERFRWCSPGNQNCRRIGTLAIKRKDQICRGPGSQRCDRSGQGLLAKHNTSGARLSAGLAYSSSDCLYPEKLRRIALVARKHLKPESG